MLDNETKRRIDTARDILVGKVPDPKSQVEQITIALIYKFMDDMDAAAEELGGHRSFFTGDFEKYGWSKLVAPGRGGFEVLNLYAEAITKMPENAGIPLLFRDIFKNAYLPYRDPETLKSFLKVINDFTYDHSERLGDAFEYLLAVLGSQGDAGQFRTPRHIIDFMVQVIDPQKHESITDPACGTAGFLISSFKHIMNANSHNGRPGAALTPDERGRLMNQIRGYDISPDMVRLSLVNLYLHGFNDPHIVEYDTLTSEERWHEYADIILANPPFMSPKGGIKPHKRFSVQSSRSEVLFVDYIAEHLSPGGRAAVIVPEGVIFQSGNAYKQLRKMLVEKYLVGVISLPAGVFNPYSGVKTSILWLDKALAKQTQQIAFVKIANDGFDLGAQRREIKQDDLPEAVAAITAYKANIINNTGFDAERYEGLALVDKSKIAENGDYNLSGDRYDLADIERELEYKLVELGKLCDIYQPKTITKEQMSDSGKYVVFGANGIIGRFDEFNHEDSEVLVTCRGATCGTVNLSEPKSWITGNAMVVKPRDHNLSKKFLYYLLQNTDLSSTISGAAQPQITRQNLAPFEIPLPPLAVQEEIVAELESYQKIIDGARQVVDNWRPRITIDPDWPTVELGEIADFKNGLNFSKEAQGEKVKILGVRHFQNYVTAPINELDEIQVASDLDDAYLLREGDLLFVRSNGNPELVGRSILIPQINEKASFSGFTIRCRFTRPVEPLFYAYLFKSDFHSTMLKNVGRGANISNLSQGMLKELAIPVPELSTQKQIIREIEREQELVNASEELITLFEQKIKDRIARVWGAG